LKWERKGNKTPFSKKIMAKLYGKLERTWFPKTKEVIWHNLFLSKSFQEKFNETNSNNLITTF